MSKEQLTSTVYGLAPWSDELLVISGDIERARRPQQDYDTQHHADFGVYSGVLESAGIDYRGGDWGGGIPDYLRDVTDLFRGFSEATYAGTGELTRWFDTNTFYRQPVIEDFLEQTEPYPHARYQEWLKLTGSEAGYQPTFLSPYAFYRLAARGDGITDTNALALSGALYSQLLAEAGESGVQSVLFHEPFIPFEGSPPEERARFIELMKMFAEFYKDIDIGIFFTYGDASAVINDVLEQDIPVAAIGADLQKTPVDKIGPVGERILLAGLVDGANTLFPSDETLAAQLEDIVAVESIAAGQDVSSVSLTHTVDLEHVPLRYALQKILQIGRVVDLVNGKESEL